MMPYDEFKMFLPNKEMRRVLFKKAMEGKWGHVVSYCNQSPWLCMERITRLRNTALHLAVSDRQESVVRQLVGIIESRFDPDEAVDVLGTRNEEGNTPLHLAVLVGHVAMCRCICDGRPQLLAARNKEGETPLFLAARVGEMAAFTCLLRDTVAQEYVNVRNKKGDSILHCAISGEHWKLAFLILKRFSNLHDIKNEEGVTPLQVLAGKPGAFPSGTYLSLFDQLIYHLIPSFAGDDHKDKLSPKTTDSTRNLNDQERDEVLEHNIPQELDASDTLPQYMIDMVEKGYDNVAQDITCDEEARKEASQIGRSSIPPNYDICFTFISLVNIALRSLVEIWITWLRGRSWWKGLSWSRGQNYIQKIKKKKETNLLSVRIMLQLLQLQNHQPYDFDRAGWNRRIALATNPFVEDSETEEGGLPDGIQSDMDEGASENDDKGKKTSEKGSNWAVVFKLEKDEPRPDVVLVRGAGGDSVNAVTQACASAKNLDEELRWNKAQEKDGAGSGQTPILLAAKNGITEMVKMILEMNPIAIHDVDMDKKNAVLLAVENRQPAVCQFLLEKYSRESSLFRAVDKDGCSALHLAAKFSDNQRRFIPGAALQMQCEVLWFEYVKNFMMPKFFPSRNNFKETADEMFTDHHKGLLEKGKEWLKDTSNSCSLVATIIATVAFATSTSVPGGTRDESGKPYLEHHLPFHIFAISSLVALCFSVTSTIMFLAILTSRHQETDFGKDLPRKLLIGMTTLFISILAMLVNFCSGHFFVLQDELRLAALPVYAVTCLPATYFAVAQLPLYIDLLWATFSQVPRHWMKKDV